MSGPPPPPTLRTSRQRKGLTGTKNRGRVRLREPFVKEFEGIVQMGFHNSLRSKSSSETFVTQASFYNAACPNLQWWFTRVVAGIASIAQWNPALRLPI